MSIANNNSIDSRARLDSCPRTTSTTSQIWRPRWRGDWSGPRRRVDAARVQGSEIECGVKEQGVLSALADPGGRERQVRVEQLTISFERFDKGATFKF